MADRKITDLTALAAGSQATGDLLTIVDVSEGAAADKNKKITVESLFKGIPSDVGIGISTPSHLVDARTASGNAQIHLRSGGDLAQLLLVSNDTSGTSQINFGDNDANNVGLISYAHSNNSLKFTVNASERLRIDNSGNVGVGTTSPAQQDGNNNPVVHLFHATSPVEFRAQRGNGCDAFFTARSAELQIGTNTEHRIEFRTNDAERMRITSSGNVGIGGTSPAHELHVSGASTPELVVEDTTNNCKAYLGSSDTNGRVGTLSNHHLQFRTNDTERMRIDTSGNVGIGTTSPSFEFQVAQSGSASEIAATSNVTSGTASRFILGNSAGTARATFNLTGGGSETAYLGTEGNFPLYFQTHGAERMRIDGSGHVGIGTASAAQVLQVHEPSSAASYVHITNTVTGSASSDGMLLGHTATLAEALVWNHENTDMRFATNNAERMRIKNSGSLLVGRTSAYNSSPGEVAVFQGSKHGVVIYQAANANYTCLNLRNTYANNNGNNVSGNMITFHDQGGTERGKIAMNGSSVSYITSSDYRLKENVVDIADGITRIKQLQPKRFNFIADDTTSVDGFLAHEAQTVVPEAVTGTHNEVDDDGNAVMQGIDQSKLVPLLTAALQEAIAEIETLKTKVAALEAG